MKFLKFFFVCALTVLMKNGQAQTWNRDYGIEWDFWAETPRAIELIQDSCYVVYTETNPLGGRMLSISNVSIENGNFLWTKNYADSLTSRIGGNYNSFDVSSNGESFAIGQRYQSLEGDEDELLNSGEFLLFDSSFNVQEAYLEGQLPDQSLYHQARFLSDGNIIVVGERSESGLGKNSILLSKFTDQGELLWTTTYNTGPNTYNITTSIASDENGNLFVAGYRRSLSNEPEYVMLCKFDSDGEFIDDLLLGNNEWETPDRSYLNPTSDGAFLYTTMMYNQDQNGFYYFAKYNNNLELVWENYLDAQTIIADVFQIKEMSDHLIAVGSWVDPILGLQWGQIMKLTLDGDLIWQRRYQHATEGNIVFNYLVDVIELNNDEGYIAVGGRNDAVTGENLWVIRLDNEGCLEPNCGADYIEDHAVTTLNIFDVYPNPVDQELNISIKEETNDDLLIKEDHSVILSDLTGRVFYNELWQVGYNNKSIAVGHLPRGSYILKITNDIGQVYIERVVKL